MTRDATRTASIAGRIGWAPRTRSRLSLRALHPADMVPSAAAPECWCLGVPWWDVPFATCHRPRGASTKPIARSRVWSALTTPGGSPFLSSGGGHGQSGITSTDAADPSWHSRIPCHPGVRIGDLLRLADGQHVTPRPRVVPSWAAAGLVDDVLRAMTSADRDFLLKTSLTERW